MRLLPVLQSLILIFAANGAPILATKAFGAKAAFPLDFGFVLPDGAPLFGPSKTIRGVVASLIAGTLCALLLGLSWWIGAAAAAAAMAGDLLSSFVKRRVGLAPQAMAPGLDQAPESLLPLIVCKQALGLGLAEVLLGTLLFWIGELLISRALFNLKIRERPY